MTITHNKLTKPTTLTVLVDQRFPVKSEEKFFSAEDMQAMNANMYGTTQSRADALGAILRRPNTPSLELQSPLVSIWNNRTRS